MAKIYTSRFSNKELKSGRYFTVGITLGRPKFNLGYTESRHCYALAPAKWMWGRTPEEFRKLYFAKMDKMGLQKVRAIIDGFVADADALSQDVVLLCFEDVREPDANCHRTVFAEWYELHTGTKIEELQDPTPAKSAKFNIKKEKNALSTPVEKAEEPLCEQISMFSI